MLAQLEDEKPICDLNLEESERVVVNALKPLSYTPTLVYEEIPPDAHSVCRDGMEKAGKMFFYTVGKQEVHAWLVEQETDAVTSASR